MNRFEQLYADLLIESEQVNKIGIFPGAFKPPHIGHFETARKACEWATNENTTTGYLYLIASNKPRSLTQQNVSKAGAVDCDSQRYVNLLAKQVRKERGSTEMVNNFRTDNLLSIQPAECERLGSASAVRTAIKNNDEGAVMSMLPDQLNELQQRQIWKILSASTNSDNVNVGQITSEQMQAIWSVFIEVLENMYTKCVIQFDVSSTSPVTDTYELVDAINKGGTDLEPERTSINLYVGTS